MTSMSHEEAVELLAVYALDAVPGPEGAEVSSHISECPRCQDELAGYRKVISALGSPASSAPPGVWDRIAAQLGGSSGAGSPGRLGSPPQLGSPGEFGAHSPGRLHAVPGASQKPARSWRRWAVSAVAAAAAVAISLLSWDVSHLNSRVGHLQAVMARSGLAQAADAAALNPLNRKVDLTSAIGHLRAGVVITPGGEGYVVSASLPNPGPGRTYQIWGLARSHAVSLGLLGPDPVPAAFRVESDVEALMVTAEPSGGSPAPTTPVLVQARI